MDFETQAIAEEIIRKRELRKSVLTSPLAITGYIWDVVRGLITLLICFLVYSSISSPDTKLIFSVLLLVYLSVLTIGAGIGQSQMAMGLLSTNLQLKTQKILLEGKDSDADLKEAELDLEKAGYALQKYQYKYFINAAFYFILYITAILNIITAY